MGKISSNHLKHSGDLLNRIRDINFRNKKLASLDIKSLFTNIPVEKAITLLDNKLSELNINFSIPKSNIIELIRLCTQQNFFSFNNKYYKQKFGLPMGSPLSGVIACLFLEFLEAGPFKNILPKNSTFLRYIDDTILICNNRENLISLVERLNEVEPSIEFTLEEEENGKLPFLDVLIIKNNNKLSFKVYRKPTNKNDMIHFYSHHNTKVKRGVLIGFYLRANRICSPEFLADEYNYIDTIFKQLKYPNFLLNQAKTRTKNILSRNETPDKNNTNRKIILPSSSAAINAINVFRESSADIVISTTQTIKQLLHKRTDERSDTAGIYKIPCNNCEKVYIGETSRKVDDRIKEHKYAMRTNNTNNACVQHRNDRGHFMGWDDAFIIIKEPDLFRRRTIEAACISQFNTIEQRPGFVNLAPQLARKILKSVKVHP